MRRLAASLFILVLAAGCAGHAVVPAAPAHAAAHPPALTVTDYNQLHPDAGRMVLYEVQARTANACLPDLGADWQRAACAARAAPAVSYHAEHSVCGPIEDLQRIKLGTLDDLLENTADYRAGITLRYVTEKVGANTLWLMPPFPDNDQWGLPSACDNLGSPYAVRDYMHVAGTLTRACIAAGRDERSDPPCWGNDGLDQLVAAAHQRGMKVMLDLAFNHFGHNYQMYDYAGYTPIRERLAGGEDLARLWDYAATVEDALVRPEILDTPAELEAAAAADPLHRKNLDALKAKCPDLKGADLVRAYGAFQEAFDWERERFDCHAPYLEYEAPGFYLGSNHRDPSLHAGDNFTNNWSDVKFLYHHEDNDRHRWEFFRTREYLFRIMNYWSSRGVDGFRLDHATDTQSGLGPREWKYIVSKVDYYADRRGQARPVYLAEEFADQMGMSHVADILTEGYLTDLCGRAGQEKDAAYVERAVANMERFGGHSYVMTALETHDERRLTDGTGFNVWTGAGFWGVGATTWSAPMLLMGQEFGETRQLEFRRSDLLRARFVVDPEAEHRADTLTRYYHSMIEARLSPPNRALLAPGRAFLPTRDEGPVDTRLFAEAKWSEDGNVVFAFHNLWERDAAQTYVIPGDLARRLSIDFSHRYRLVDILSGKQLGPCHEAAELTHNFYVAMDRGTRFQWMRLELCP